jgi:hypothetical protein
MTVSDDASIEVRLRMVEDKQEIHDLLMRYCRGVDRCDAEMIASCYHVGGIDDHGDFVVAAEDVGPLFARMAARSPLGGMHFVGNCLIEVEGDTAFAESYFMAIKDVARAEERLLRIRSGRYIDRLERCEGRWGIVERVLADEWNAVNPIAERLGGPEKYVFGTKDRTDLVYTIRKGRIARQPDTDLEALATRKV